MQDIKDEIKSNIRIIENQLNWYGAKPARLKNKYSCPKCGSRDNLGMHESDGIYKIHCFSDGGDCIPDTDIFGFVATMEGLDNTNDFTKIKKLIADREGIPIPEYNYSKKDLRELETHRAAIEDIQSNINFTKDILNNYHLILESANTTDEQKEEAHAESIKLEAELDKYIKELNRLKLPKVGDEVPLPKLQVFSASKYKELGLGADKNFLIEGLIYEKSLGFVIAPPKVGKTNFAYNLALNVSKGKDFIGHKTNGKRNVLYLLLEGTFKQLVDNYGESDNLFLIENKNFSWEEYRDEFIQVIKDNNIELVVIDSFYRMTDRNMSKSEFIKPILKDLDNLTTELGCTFLMMHHTNRLELTENYQNKVAGSSDIVRVGEFFIYLEKPKKTEEEELEEYGMSNEEINKLPLKMILSKNDYRYGKTGFTKYNLSIDMETGYIKTERFKLESKRANPEDRLEDLYNYAALHVPVMEKINREEICKLLSEQYTDISFNSIRKHYGTDVIKRLETRGLIEKKGREYVYIGNDTVIG